MGRALVILAIAVPVLGWLLAAISLLVLYDVVTGTPIEPWEWALGIAMLLGAAIVLGVSGRAVWRARREVGWRIYGAFLGAGAIAGIAGGTWLAGHEILRREASLDRRAVEVCAYFDVPSATCPEIARACVQHVSAHPPAVERGLGPGPLTIGTRRVIEARDVAAVECVRGGGPP